MNRNVDQVATGSGNIQAGRDIIVHIAPAVVPETSTAKFLHFLVIASLLGTTLPHPGFNVAASIGALLAWLTWARVSRHVVKAPILVATAFSLLTGCSGPLFSNLDPPPMICPTGQLCQKVGVAQGIGILGLGLNNITTETARKNGDINKIFAVHESRSYGIISMAKVRVYGE